MKNKITLSLLSLMSAASVMAQPTLTAATSTPTVGTKELIFSNAQFAPGNAGASQTWDFTGQTFTTLDSEVFENCSTANSCASFPGTTAVARQSNSGSSFSYYIASSTALSFNGANANGTIIYYNNPEDLYHFPFTYGDAYVDTWSTTFVSSGYTYYRTGVDSVTADGYGVLKTPAGTFSNTLRIKRISTFRDSSNVSSSPVIINYKEIGYNWNDAAHKNYLFNAVSITATSNGIPSTSTNSAYVNEPTTPSGIGQLNANGFSWKLFPNPAKDNVQLAIGLARTDNVMINVMDFTGKTVYSSPIQTVLPAGANKITIPVSGLPAGFYTIRMIVGNAVATDKLVVQ